MPKYELMYIIGSQVADDEIPKVTGEITKYIADAGGIMEKHEELGKKKLAYPIKKSKIGHYVLDSFEAPGDKINDIEHKVRTSQSIIRHLVINLDEAVVRMEKDRVVQAKLKLRRPPVDIKDKPSGAKPERKIQIDLDAEIEKALESKDLK